MADIVERAETARGTFYLYFANKEAVFGKVLAEGVDELYRSAGAPQPDVRAAIRSYLDAYARRTGLWRCTVEAALASPSAAALWMRERDAFMERIARHLASDPQARPLDAPVVALALGTMVEWFAFTSLVVRGEPLDLDRAADALAAVWEHAVHPD